MPLFQFLRTLKSQFWNTPDTSGPTLGDVMRFWDTPRPLRLQPRKRPPPFGAWEEPERLTPMDAGALTTFWRAYYSGDDWVFRPDVKWVADILGEPHTLVLAVREGIAEGRRIVGSVVCRGLTGDEGVFRLGTLKLPNAYMIEGLCIDPSWRGQHLAGWLIAWIDHCMNQDRPQAFCWSRESPPRDITYIATHTYGYLPLVQAQESKKYVGSGESGESGGSGGSGGLEEIPWEEFRRIWATYVPRWDALTYAAFPTQLPRDPLRVWRKGTNYVVVSDTRRRMLGCRDGEGKIWEVQFCGDLYELVTGLGGGEEDGTRRMLEVVGSLLSREGPGLLFVTSAPWQGGCTSTWPRPWVIGTAGFHTTYIYNFMPPAFHRMMLLFLRNEL
jgi:hypothetical protein